MAATTPLARSPELDLTQTPKPPPPDRVVTLHPALLHTTLPPNPTPRATATNARTPNPTPLLPSPILHLHRQLNSPPLPHTSSPISQSHNLTDPSLSLKCNLEQKETDASRDD
ncbi:hypothetical protein KC19_8G144800 [Ceratodon purpureus]|uniref:Uncharacterized protein n=1 Tax=Ceratodon purpureus TaxID=3225 RepID=A0A8T0H416_CERPU|nr:hypothetical protein KC19_8G144800 [Ceratodon purpureus]